MGLEVVPSPSRLSEGGINDSKPNERREGGRDEKTTDALGGRNAEGKRERGKERRRDRFP